MATDATDHEIGPRLRKKHDFNTVLQECSTKGEGLQARIQSPVDAVRRVVDQCHPRKRIWSSCSRRRRRNIYIYIPRLRPIIIHAGVVKSTNDKVYRTTCLDGDRV